MTKVKITTNEWELNGEVIEKPVTLFGTSGHIPFAKKHVGKVVSVVVPTDPEYVWILSEKDLKSIVSACNKILANRSGKLVFFQKECVNNLKGKKFSLDDLHKVLAILQSDGRYDKLAETLKSSYNL